MSALLSPGRTIAVLLLLCFLSYRVFAGENSFSPQGRQFAPAGSLAGDQTHPHLQIDSSGGYLIWQDNATDGDGLGISALKLERNLSASSGPFRVNQEGAGDQENPQVALLKNGGAVFVWQSGRQSFQEIYARFVGPDGTFVTGDIVVNTTTAWHQHDPVVTSLPDGKVVVAWASFGQDNPDKSISMDGVYAQILSADGKKIGAEFRVNASTPYNQRNPAIATLPSGNFIVVWVSETFRGLIPSTDPFGRDPDGTGGILSFSVDIFGSIYDPQGGVIKEQIKLNAGAAPCANPGISVSADGFSVVWSELAGVAKTDLRGSPINGWDIFARSFTADGKPKAVPLRVNTFIRGDQFRPKISALGGELLVIWSSLGQEGFRQGVYGQVLASDAASLIGQEFRVNTTTLGPQNFPTVAADGINRFFVVWGYFVGGLASFDLAAQRFASEQPLFAPPAPFVSALSQSRLSVTWPELGGYNVAQYELYLDDQTAPIVVAGGNIKEIGQLLPATSHLVRLAYRLSDGRLSPLSEPTTANTWSEDENFDGLPDDWQAQYWGTNQGRWPAARADSDNDGASNTAEFLAGTNPTDASSVLRVEIVFTSQGPRLSWTTQPGLVYQVQYSTNFVQWQNLGNPRFAVGTSDSISINGQDSMAVYRLVRVR